MVTANIILAFLMVLADGDADGNQGGCGYDVAALALNRLKIAYTSSELGSWMSPREIVSFGDLRRFFEFKGLRVETYEFTKSIVAPAIHRQLSFRSDGVVVLRLPTTDQVGHFVIVESIQESGLMFVNSLKGERGFISWDGLFGEPRLGCMVIRNPSLRFPYWLECIFFSLAPAIIVIYFTLDTVLRIRRFLLFSDK
jgi:hypothetical protein